MTTVVDFLVTLPEHELREKRDRVAVELQQLDEALARKGTLLPPRPTSSCRRRPGGTRQRVMDAIRKGGPMTPSEVMAVLKDQDSPPPQDGAVYNMMTRLVKESSLVRERGHYDLPGRESTTARENPFSKKLGKGGPLSTDPPSREAT